VRPPASRSAWRELLAGYADVGATGVIVNHAPNLLDILRNPEEDDRQDLGMAVGEGGRQSPPTQPSPPRREAALTPQTKFGPPRVRGRLEGGSPRVASSGERAGDHRAQARR